MRALSLKTRISLALLVAFIVVAAIATVFAQASFRDTEVRHVREDAQARVDAIAQMIDTRFLALGQDANAAANDAGHIDPRRVLEQMHRAGFSVAIVVGQNNTVIAKSGEAQWNDTLVELLLRGAPPAHYPATVYHPADGWFLVGSRSTDLKTAVVGAMSDEFLSDAYLVDALIHPEYAHAFVTRGGQVIAASVNYPEDRASVEVADANATGLLRSFAERDVHYLQTSATEIVDGYVEALAPSAVLAERVDAMTLRFLLSMAIAFGIGGAVTILLVAYSFRPLDRITDAARRLGRGEEDLRLELRDRDELGTLANVLNQSALALGNARRAEAARAEEARLSAEDFELAVGDLSRAVGEAETPHEVGERLVEGLLRVTTARAVLVRQGEETLAAADRDPEGSPQGLAALFASEPGAFHVTRMRSGDSEVVVAALPERGDALAQGEARKIDILTAQAAIAIQRARANVALKHATLQKETFLDILSHDLKNPIAVARGRVELLGMKDAGLVEKLSPIEKSLDRATRIIDEALLLSKLERAEQLERAPVDLASLVEDSAAAIRPLGASKGITIQVDVAPNTTWPASRLLQRAIENLVSNAVKWSPEGGHVEIRVARETARCRILVVDHGPGIPPQDRERLFARFERADRTGVKGTGLGLAIAKRVGEMHGGSISIEDTPGGGCTFVLDLPADARPTPAPVARAGKGAHP